MKLLRHKELPNEKTNKKREFWAPPNYRYMERIRSNFIFEVILQDKMSKKYNRTKKPFFVFLAKLLVTEDG